MSIETRTLRYFIAAAEELNFGRAAARLGIVQPALSAQIKSLEEKLGAVLLTRTRQRVELSPVGQIFLAEARRAVAQVERAEAVVRDAAEGRIGSLQVGYVGSAPFGRRMPRIISAFRRAYPDVRITLEELSPQKQVECLDAGTIDVGFVRLPLPGSTPGLQFINRVEESVIVALRHDHPLARKDNIEPHELRDEPFIVGSAHESAGWVSMIWRICGDGGFAPNVTQTSPHLPTVIGLVSAGLGVTFVPETIDSLRFEGVVYRRLSNGKYRSEVAIMTSAQSQSAVLRTFLDVCRQVE
jgi:LysR family transcriptional regulator, benzoate and cis,cis-muconate-responsive activator of ben and cat genes